MSSQQQLEPWAIALVTLGSVAAALLAAYIAARPAYYDLKDKVVVITGGSSGIGKSTAQVCNDERGLFHRREV